MRIVIILFVLLILFGLTLPLIACSGFQFNFTCNDYNSELTLEENAKNLKECRDGEMFQWTKPF